MSTTRSVMDAVNIDTNEKIYFNSYAPATYMADGRSAENAINSLDSKLTNAIVEINSHFSSIEEDITDLNIDLGTKQDIIEDLTDIRTAAYFNEGVNAVTSLSSIPVTKRLCIITP